MQLTEAYLDHDKFLRVSKEDNIEYVYRYVLNYLREGPFVKIVRVGDKTFTHFDHLRLRIMDAWLDVEEQILYDAIKEEIESCKGDKHANTN